MRVSVFLLVTSPVKCASYIRHNTSRGTLLSFNTGCKYSFYQKLALNVIYFARTYFFLVLLSFINTETFPFCFPSVVLQSCYVYFLGTIFCVSSSIFFVISSFFNRDLIRLIFSAVLNSFSTFGSALCVLFFHSLK